MGEAIVITSGKGGVGKSTTAVNLATGLTKLKKRVVLIDMDMGLRSLDVLLGLHNNVVYDLVDVAEGVCRLKQALTRDREHEGLFLIAAAQTRDSSAVTVADMDRVVWQLKSQYDYVIIDCPAGVGRGFRNAVCCADRALIVAVPEIISLRDAERIIGILEHNSILHPQLVINRVTPEHYLKNAPVSVGSAEDMLKIQTIAIIPEDGQVTRAASEGKPVVTKNCPSGQAYMRMARRVVGESVPIERMKKPGLLSRMRAALRG